MEPIFAFLANGWGYVSQHLVPFILLLCVYFLVPQFVTKIFAWLEEKVNKIKFTVFGYSIDFSQYSWDDELNVFLRDYVILLLSKASQIKASMSSGELSTEEGEKQLEALTQEVVDYFMDKAPTYLRKLAEEKYGSNRVALAEFLVLKIKGILFDVKTAKAMQVRALDCCKKK